MYTVFIIWVCGSDVVTRQVNTEDEARAIILFAITEGLIVLDMSPLSQQILLYVSK